MDQLAKFIEDAMARAEAARGKPEPAPSKERIRGKYEWMEEHGYLPYDPAAFHRLAIWLAGPRRRGLILGGNVGTGKTEFVRLVTTARIYTATQWAENANGIRQFLGGTFDTVIDDMTGEPVASHYGQRAEALSDVIHQCHDSWLAHGALTYITINLPHNHEGNPDLSIIRSRYGDRTADRLREMCVVILFEGESLRGLKKSGENPEKDSPEG